MSSFRWFKDTALLWIFVLILIVSGMLVVKLEENKSKKDSMQSYHLELPKEEIIETSGTLSDLTVLNARYALLMDASNRRVLFEKSGYEQVPMASTTKIMTLLITLENADLNDVVTVSEYAASMPDVQLGIRKDEKYRLSDLVYSLMLESHNDTAVAIAEHVGGSVDGFAKMMNEKAVSLGAYQTHFVTPNGLDAKDHYTTAYDLALIASYAIENKTFCEIIKTPSFTFHEQSTGRSFTVHNKDRFLTSYEGAIGIKTGFTGNAGYCFVGAVEKENKRFVSVVLACGLPPHKTYKWKDTEKMMDYGIKGYEEKEILKKGTTFQKIAVEDSIENQPITPYVKESVALLLNKDEKVSFDIKLPKKLEAPVKKEETIGEITIKIEDKVYKVLPLYTNEKRTKVTYSYHLRKIIEQYFLLNDS